MSNHRRNIMLVMGCSFLPICLSAQSFSLPERKAQLGEVHYSARVGSADVTGGERFRALVVPEGGVLDSVQVSVAGSVVHALRFVHADSTGVRDTTTVGAEESNWQAPFVIPPGRQLVGVTGQAAGGSTGLPFTWTTAPSRRPTAERAGIRNSDYCWRDATEPGKGA